MITIEQIQEIIIDNKINKPDRIYELVKIDTDKLRKVIIKVFKTGWTDPAEKLADRILNELEGDNERI